MINPDLFQEVTQLADLLRAKFSPTEFIPGCLVKSVADKSQYATNNGWIEAVCGQHNQQRVRWKSNETVAVNDFVDVLYFPDRRLFEAYGLGGAGAIAGAAGGNAWPLAGQNLLEGVNYATATLLIAAMSSGDIGYLGSRSSSEAVTANESGITLRGVGASATIFTTTFTVTDPTTLQDIKAVHSGAANTIGFDVSDSVTLIDCIGIADSTGTSARGLNVTGSAQVTIKGGYYEAQNGTAVDVFADASATVFLDGPTLFSGIFGGSGVILGWYLDTTGASHFVHRTGGTTEDISFNNGNLAFGSGTAITGFQASQAEVDAGTDAARIVTPLTAFTAAYRREKLTAARTYYVRTDGSDSNTGLVDSAGGAFLTWQKAIDVAAAFDLNGFTVTIDIGDGTYSIATTVTTKRFVGDGTIDLMGNAGTPANVLLRATSAIALFTMTHGPCNYTINGMKFDTNQGTGCLAISMSKKSILTCSNINFGAMSSTSDLGMHMILDEQSVITWLTGYTVSGRFLRHFNLAGLSLMTCTSKTITITGTPTGSHWAYMYGMANCDYYSNTFSGALTAGCTRFDVSFNATLRFGGVTLPGSVAGAVSNGGVAA